MEARPHPVETTNKQSAQSSSLDLLIPRSTPYQRLRTVVSDLVEGPEMKAIQHLEADTSHVATRGFEPLPIGGSGSEACALGKRWKAFFCHGPEQVSPCPCPCVLIEQTKHTNPVSSTLVPLTCSHHPAEGGRDRRTCAMGGRLCLPLCVFLIGRTVRDWVKQTS